MRACSRWSASSPTHDKCICAIGHGIQVLTAAGLTKGRTVTCHAHVRIEVERSGGNYVNKPAVRDGRLVTAQSWKAHPEFYREVFACLGNESRRACDALLLAADLAGTSDAGVSGAVLAK